MFSIVILGVGIASLLIVALVTLVFYDVAIANHATTHSTNKVWQPPMIRGEELCKWARQKAAAITKTWLEKPRRESTVLGLVNEISDGVTFAIARSEPEKCCSNVSCPSCKQRRIGVTPPEVLAISHSIRTTLPKPIVQRIHDQSVRNAETVSNCNAEQYEQANITCPLWDRQKSCLVFASRPLHCRGCCKKSAQGSQDPIESRAKSVGKGTEAGLSESLKHAKLDGTIYELNSALAAALENPQAAKHWIEGKSVFNQCSVIQN